MTANYAAVRAHAEVQGHHGGHAVVYRAPESADPIESGYYVVDDETETVVNGAIPFQHAGYAYGVAEGYDRGVGVY